MLSNLTRPFRAVADMIAMIACGHTLGNVHSVDFPDLVSGSASDANVALALTDKGGDVGGRQEDEGNG